MSEPKPGEVKAGFILGSDGEIYVQLPADNQFGFAICDEDQSWPGGLGSGLTSWTLLNLDDTRITNGDKARLDWIINDYVKENRIKVEVCFDVEWVRNNAFNDDGIEEHNLDEAVGCYQTRTFSLLEEAGFKVIWAATPRRSYHGWNGAHFVSRLGCVGSFKEFTGEQLEVVSKILTEAQKHASETWKSNKKSFNYATDADSGTLKADSFEDAWLQLKDMLTAEAVQDGGWGWVEDQDGKRFKICC